MAQSYQGYFLPDGRLMTNGSPIKLPTEYMVVVNVLDDKVDEPGVKTRTKAQKQKEALSRLYAGLATIDNEPLDAEFDAIMFRKLKSVKAKTKRPTSGSVDLNGMVADGNFNFYCTKPLTVQTMGLVDCTD